MRHVLLQQTNNAFKWKKWKKRYKEGKLHSISWSLLVWNYRWKTPANWCNFSLRHIVVTPPRQRAAVHEEKEEEAEAEDCICDSIAHFLAKAGYKKVGSRVVERGGAVLGGRCKSHKKKSQVTELHFNCDIKSPLWSSSNNITLNGLTKWRHYVSGEQAN